MATNPYSYGSLGQRWTVGEPTSKSLLDVSRVKADANRWALEQLIVDPDDTANFVLTAPGLNIDSNTLYVDGVNNSVGFGLTNPNDYAFNGTPSWVASGGAGNASVIVVSGTTSIGYLAFADGTTGTDRYSGNIQYNHSTNTMSFRTNGGVEGMTINSAQDLAVGTDKLYVDVSASAVGVGTSSPAGLGGRSLNIKAPTANGADLTLEADNGTNFGVLFSGATTNDPFSIYSNTGFKFATASDKNATGFSEKMRLHSNGDLAVDTDTLYVDASADRVGINTASSNYPLQVMGEVFAGVMSGFETAGKFYLGRGDGTGTDVRYHYIEANNSTTDSSNYLAFDVHTGVTTTSTTEVLRLRGDGKVGINETSPSTLLHVTEGGEPPAEGMLILEANSSSRQLRIQPPTNADNGFFDSRGGNMTFLDDGTEIFRYNASTFSTSSGINVGIGTASPSALAHLYSNNSGSNTELRIEHNNASGTATAVMRFKRAGADFAYVGGAATAISGASATDLGLTVPSGKNIVFATANTESARIDSSGNLLVNATSAFGIITAQAAAGNNVATLQSAGATAGTRFIRFDINGSTEVGSITYTGSGTAYNTSSDYRLKENVVGITDGITRIKSLKPSRFNFISNADRTVDGFVAHEVSDIVPEAITGEKDAVNDEGNPEYQGIDQSKLVPLLTAALQEAITKIETLETKVAALEAA